MAKKKKHIRVKNLIRDIGKTISLVLGFDFGIGGTTYKDGIWSCVWSSSYEIPHWFDTSVRESAVEEIKPYVEKKYNKVINYLMKEFGYIEHSPYGITWYNFTYHFPPDGIAIPEEWDHVDGVFQKVKDARLLTEEEINERIKYWENASIGPHSKYCLNHLIDLKWQQNNWQQYFRFVGNSPFTDELFEHTHYAPTIRMYGEFSFIAFGELIPSDGYMYYI